MYRIMLPNGQAFVSTETVMFVKDTDGRNPGRCHYSNANGLLFEPVGSGVAMWIHNLDLTGIFGSRASSAAIKLIREGYLDLSGYPTDGILLDSINYHKYERMRDEMLR